LDALPIYYITHKTRLQHSKAQVACITFSQQAASLSVDTGQAWALLVLLLQSLDVLSSFVVWALILFVQHRQSHFHGCIPVHCTL
jgi:hypothetical protein